MRVPKRFEVVPVSFVESLDGCLGKETKVFSGQIFSVPSRRNVRLFLLSLRFSPETGSMAHVFPVLKLSLEFADELQTIQYVQKISKVA